MTARTFFCWGHPLLGLAATALAVRAATLGVASRRPGRLAAASRAAHRRLTPWVWLGVVVAWIGGVLSTWLWRDDLDVLASGHFQVGCAVALLVTLAAVLSRWVPTVGWVRVVHPWVGAIAVLAAGVQVFLGLQIMPR